jgi:hypothetical protein
VHLLLGCCLLCAPSLPSWDNWNVQPAPLGGTRRDPLRSPLDAPPLVAAAFAPLAAAGAVPGAGGAAGDPFVTPRFSSARRASGTGVHVCTCVYVCMGVYVRCATLCACVCACVYVCLCMCLRMCACVCVPVYVCLCVCAYVCLCVPVCACVCVCVCLCMLMCVCAYLYVSVAEQRTSPTSPSCTGTPCLWARCRPLGQGLGQGTWTRLR